MKRTERVDLDVSAAVDQLEELPPWMTALREAMTGSITGDDVRQVMQKQVEKAKGGDMRAAAFVMTQAHKMMETQGKTRRPVTIVQNNYYDSPRPDAPIEPGEPKDSSLRKLRARARAHEPITGRPEDRHVRPVSDEEEKELRRRQQAAEEEDDDDTGPEGD